MSIIEDSFIKRTTSSRILYTRITIMTFDFITTDEITGVVIGDPSYTNDSTSDIRRTMTIELHPTDSTFDIHYGSKIWLDKYVRVEIGIKTKPNDDITYFNMGTYVIDNPSKTYSATENKITLNCLDLMSRLTGIRGGVIEGITHVIPAGANIRDTIIAILKEGQISKYVVDECTIDVPNDINIDGGSSLYDLLRSLVDLLPNYQIYFDVDGVFHYDMIPNGQNEPVMANDNTWKDILIDYNINYDFENVKNCIDILGGVHDSQVWTGEVNYERSGWNDLDPTYVATDAVTYNTDIDYDNIQSTNDFIESLTGITVYQYNHGMTCAGLYTAILFPMYEDYNGYINLSNIVINDGAGVTVVDFRFNNYSFEVKESEKMLYFKVDSIVSATTSGGGWRKATLNCTALGEYQARATLYETNHDSPFYTGVDYYANPILGKRGSVDLLNLYIDKSLNPDEITSSVFQYSLSTQSEAKTNVSDLVTNEYGYCFMKIYYRDNGKWVTNGNIYYNIDPKELLLGTHIVKSKQVPIEGQSNTYRQVFFSYTPYSVGTLRIVLSGDEYDNIWSDDLAMQRAKFELYQRCRLLDTVSINILPQYWLDTNWLVEITLPNKNGEETTDQYLIKSISTSGGVDGTQTVTMMKYYPYYPSIN